MIRWRITQGSLIQYGSVSNFRSGPLETSLDHNTWIRAAMAALAKGGVDQIRVEVIAQNLGVTKGGFYRRFKDRPALIEATLAVWAEGRIAAIEEQTRLAGARPSARLKSLIKLYAEKINAEGMAVELNIRQWARTCAEAAAVVARVDNARLRSVAKLYSELGANSRTAETQAFLFYSFVFGQSLLFLDKDNCKRSLVSDCANALAKKPGTPITSAASRSVQGKPDAARRGLRRTRPG
jgi:AcrR family transcriptional regulator